MASPSVVWPSERAVASFQRRAEDPGGDEGDGEVALARSSALQERLEAEGAEHPQDRGDVTVGQAPPDPERLVGPDEPLTPETPLDRVDDRGRQGGQRGECPVLDLAPDPV
jgi:hypothetical protein